MSSMSRVVVVNGQTFNTEQLIDGVEWEVTDVTGLGDPASVSTSEQNVAQDGAWATTSYRAPRAVGIEGVIRATDEIRAELAADQLRRLISLADFPLTLRYASGDRTIWVRRDGEVTLHSRELPTEFPFTVVLKAIDPAIYAGDASGSGNIILTTGLPNSSGGVAFPVTFPITFTGSSSTGDMVCTLAAGGKLMMRVNGSVTDPSVVVENALGVFRLAWRGTIPDGMWLDIDPEKRTALLQGQSTRVPYIRAWPQLTPGLNTIRFRAATFDTGTLTCTIRPTL